MIGSLQSLRGIFAIMIFLHHFPINGKGWFDAGGSCGVDFFLILSGFVLCVGYENKVLSSDFHYRHFIFKRLIRVYPLHIFCLLNWLIIQIIATLLNFNVILKLIPNIVLLQSWFPFQSIYFSGNAVSWCLSDLMFFYCAFPFLIRIFVKNRKKAVYSMGIIVSAYLVLINIIPQDKIHYIVYICPLTRLIDFIIGMLLWQLYISIESSVFVKQITDMHISFRTLIEIIPLLILGIAICIYPYIAECYSPCAWWWMPMAILILTLTVFNKSGGGISILLNNRFLLIFGNISFSFYMLHQIIINVSITVFSHLNLSINIYLIMSITFIISLITSLLVYRYIETPIGRYLSLKLKYIKC